MAKSAPTSVFLRGEWEEKEGKASSAIIPGHLIEFGGSNDLRVHSTAAANARKAFALENEFVGAGMTTAYATGDRVRYGVFESGSEVYALVAAGATAITKGAALESAGDGTLRISSTAAATSNLQRDGIVGYALEAVDNSAGGSVARIRVEVA